MTTHSVTTNAVAGHTPVIVDGDPKKKLDEPLTKTVDVWKHDQNLALDDDEVDPEAIIASEITEDGTTPDWGIQNETSTNKNVAAVLPTHGTLSLKFHDPKSLQHDGIDIELDKASPIHAAWAGQVLFAQCTDGRGGCTVMIRHPNGLSTYYSQLSGRPWVRRGDLVAQGQTLGQAGARRGHSTIEHLHFEIRSGQRAVNPLVYVKY